jgi:hypothetical protein
VFNQNVSAGAKIDIVPVEKCANKVEGNSGGTRSGRSPPVLPLALHFYCFSSTRVPSEKEGYRLDVFPSTAGRVSPSVSQLLCECSKAHSPAAGLCSFISLNICDEIFYFIPYLGSTRAYATDNSVLFQVTKRIVVWKAFITIESIKYPRILWTDHSHWLKTGWLFIKDVLLDLKYL